MFKSKKHKLQLLALCTGFLAMTLGVLFASGKGVGGLLHGFATSPVTTYSLTLDKGNKVSSGGDVIQKTHRGSSVTFTYSSVSSSSNGHTQLNSGGSIVNKDIIHSITSFNVVYSGSGTLKSRIAYSTQNWGEYFNLNSNQTVSTGTNPYFVEFKAFNGSIDISSVYIEYSCQTNPDAEGQDIAGAYEITFKTTDSDSTTNIANNSTELLNTVNTGASYISNIVGATSGDYVYQGEKGIRLGKSGNPGYITITFNQQQVAHSITSISVNSAQWVSSETGKTDGGKLNFYVNGSSDYTQITPSNGGAVAVNGTLSTLRVETTEKRAYLCGLTLNYVESGTPGVPDTPLFEVGFGAVDANKNTYTTNSIFAVDKGLSVYSILSNNSHNSLSEGTNGYSYTITDALNNVIDQNEKFPAEGIYTLTVSYKDYIPVVIQLNVQEYVYIVDVSAAMTTTTFTTASILSQNLQNNLTATLELSNGTYSSSISYNDFEENDIAIKLLSPKGFTHDITKPFGTAGTWTLKVYDTNDEAMYFNISLTVNAIPVDTISLNQTSKTLYPKDQLQLTATVGHENATNQVYIWSSNNEAVATVSETGLVTAVAVGGATIKATAIDGSNVFGSCSITVVAKPEGPEWTEITDFKEISKGDELVIAYEYGSTYKELSGISDTATPYGTQASYSTKGEPNGVYPVTVVDGYNSSTFALQNGSNYLNWSSGNSLSVVGSVNQHSSWEFGSTTLMNAADNSRELQYNTSSPRFACYTGTQKDLTIFKHNVAISPVYPTSISLSGTTAITIGGTSELSVSYNPSDTNVKNVIFSSDHEEIATVSNEGVVTGVAQGNATITATAETANSGTTSATINITVSPIAVTSVSLSSNSESVKIGKTVTLVASVSPTNATNKDVTWSSNKTSIATVSNAGVVTGVSAGTATITVTTVDGNKTATCTVVVQETSAGGEETFSITYTDLPSAYQTGSTVYTADSGIKFQAYNCAGGYSAKMQFKASSGYLQTTEALELQSVTINDRESNSLTVYGSNSAGSFSTEITGTNDVYDLSGYTYFKVAREGSGAGYCSSITVLTGTPTPTDPTSIILSPTSAEIAPGGTKQLSVSYVPSNANQNKEITWTTSNSNVATVSSDGLVSVKSTASAGQSATITATLKNIATIKATCSISVIEQSKDDHTVLIYMCGADLESKNYLASGDITEILKVSGQPDDVNIVIETGGASSWASTHGISSTYLERYHVENKSIVRDDQLTYKSMGLSSTLQSFIEYGLNNYPADRTGLVFWNHGGGMRGVCYDEKKNDDVLKNSEIRTAVSSALSNCGMSGQKLEWVGYDACLMAVQDIAITNADYFNYMIASEESEAGYGWDYDNWVDDLYAKKSTTTILKAIVDSFISDNGGASSSSGDQTLSYMNLSYAVAYKTAWENLASALNSVVTNNNKSSFNNAIKNNVKHYADSDYDYFCTFDAWDFVDKLANNSAFSSFRVDSSYTTAVKNAHANFVGYNLAQKGAGVSKGLCMYWPNSTQYSDVNTYYTTSETTLTTWRSFCVNKGTHA